VEEDIARRSEDGTPMSSRRWPRVQSMREKWERQTRRRQAMHHRALH